MITKKMNSKTELKKAMNLLIKYHHNYLHLSYI